MSGVVLAKMPGLRAGALDRARAALCGRDWRPDPRLYGSGTRCAYRILGPLGPYGSVRGPADSGLGRDDALRGATIARHGQPLPRLYRDARIAFSDLGRNMGHSPARPNSLRDSVVL